MPSTLKNGETVEDSRLGRLYEEDWRSLNFLVGSIRKSPTTPLISDHKPRSASWRCDLWLDQGVEGACVSTGCGHELAADPVEVQGVTFPWCRDEIYHPAQHDDPWPGCSLGPECPIEPHPEAYEGTSTLAGVKQLKRLGFITGYTHAITLEQAVLGLAHQGPAICGFNWYDEMQDTDENGFIQPYGRITGGHALLAVGVEIVFKFSLGGWLCKRWKDVDLRRSYITLHNSWGKSWGENGRAKITLHDFGKLLNEQGEVTFVERTDKKVVA